MATKKKRNLKKTTIKLLIFLIFISALLYSCVPQIVIEPEKLPPAKVGEYYEQGITIYATYPYFGWTSIGPMVDSRISTNFGTNSEMTTTREEYNNTIWIKGTPQHKGKYRIHVNSGFYGGGVEVDETFELVVE